MKDKTEDFIALLLGIAISIPVLSALYFFIFLDAFWYGNWGGFVELTPGRIDWDALKLL